MTAILGFDTATPATAVALWDESSGLALQARDDPPPGSRPAHTARLLELIVDVLGCAAIGWDDVERIAVGVGPGTFTGLRIGIATARALAQSRSISLVGISTLESLALGAASAADGGGPGTVLAVLDARRGEAFAAAWHVPEMAPVAPPRALAPEALVALVAEVGPTALAVGDGAIKFREVLEPSGASVPEDDSQLHSVNAINHCRLAVGRDAGAPDQIRPEYLRLPDAELTRRATPDR
jgi:tRNA threonylcarbamoyladenosine biosynthesis protein TsaB